jgi:hypothetical protein
MQNIVEIVLAAMVGNVIQELDVLRAIFIEAQAGNP